MQTVNVNAIYDSLPAASKAVACLAVPLMVGYRSRNARSAINLPSNLSRQQRVLQVRVLEFARKNWHQYLRHMNKSSDRYSSV